MFLTVIRGKCKRTSFKQTLKSELFLIIPLDLFNVGTNGWLDRLVSLEPGGTIVLLKKLSFLAVLMG